MLHEGRIDSSEVMYMKQRNATLIAASLGMLVLILDAKTALAGAQAGLQLCIQTLIPSLFPFFIFSILLTSSLSGQGYPIFRPLERLCRIPAGSGCLLVIGLLGGYPTGAQNIALASRRGQLSGLDAARMLGFCNNAGPAFLFGMVGQFFDNPLYPWRLWLIHMASALIVSLALPGNPTPASPGSQSKPLTLSNALETSVRVMATVCGWVVFFRIILEFLDRWVLWMFPVSVQVLLKGLLELSNGCVLLGQVTHPGLRFILASVMLALGGLCVAMQTRSVTENLSLAHYFPGKLLQGMISFLLAWCFQPGAHRYDLPLPLLFGILTGCVILIFSLRYRKNKGSFPAAIGV